MGAQENEAILRRGYEAFNTGDMETLTKVFSPNAVWHTPGRNPLSGDHRGREAVFAYFGGLAEKSGGTLHVDLHDIVANDRHLVGIQTDIGQRGDKKLKGRAALVFHMENRQVVEAWEQFADQQAMDDFLS
jgi:ketosteroid isomerase-like protein